MIYIYIIKPAPIFNPKLTNYSFFVPILDPFRSQLVSKTNISHIARQCVDIFFFADDATPRLSVIKPFDTTLNESNRMNNEELNI